MLRNIVLTVLTVLTVGSGSHVAEGSDFRFGLSLKATCQHLHDGCIMGVT